MEVIDDTGERTGERKWVWGKEQERLQYWRNVRENKQKGKQNSKSKEMLRGNIQSASLIFFIALV